MAITNSITIGKGSGKIGNIILQSYNGKTFARQLNETISTPPTQPQINNQNRMFNCSRSAGLIQTFFGNFKARNQAKLSFVAYFISQTFNDFTFIRANRSFISIRELAEKSYGNATFIMLSQIVLLYDQGAKIGVRVFFEPQVEQWEDNLVLYIYCSNISFPFQSMPVHSAVIRSQNITLADWNNKFVTIDIEDFDTQFVVAYDRQYYTYSDNFLFSPVFE